MKYLFFSTSINHQSSGAYAGWCVASPTLLRYPLGSLRASLHEGPLSIPSTSQQDSSTFPSHELCGRPIGLLHPGLSLSKTARQAGSTSGKRATCPYSLSWRCRIVQAIGFDPVSRSKRRFVTRSNQQYPMILRRSLLPKASIRLSRPPVSVHVSQPYSKTGSTSDLKIRILVLLHR